MNILRIDASARTEGSASRRLSEALSESLAAGRPDAKVVVRDLALEPPPLLDGDFVRAFDTAPEARSEAQQRLLATSVAYIDELRAADAIVIGVPIYNFGIPAALKAWIDLVVRARETFRYTPEGPQGLLDGKRAYLGVASGGTQVGGELDFATPYLRHALGLIGIGDVEVFAADGLIAGGEAKVEAVEQVIRERLRPGTPA